MEEIEEDDIEMREVTSTSVEKKARKHRNFFKVSLFSPLSGEPKYAFGGLWRSKEEVEDCYKC